MAGNGQKTTEKAKPGNQADFTRQALKGDKRWGAGVIPYVKMGYWEPDYQPKDTDILSVHRITPQKGSCSTTWAKTSSCSLVVAPSVTPWASKPARNATGSPSRR